MRACQFGGRLHAILACREGSLVPMCSQILRSLSILLKKQAESNKPHGAICASPAIVLEPHGLLKGKKAPADPTLCNKLSDQGACENRVVVDGNVITSGGPGTSMEYALAIVEKFFGRGKALELARSLVFL